MDLLCKVPIVQLVGIAALADLVGLLIDRANVARQCRTGFLDLAVSLPLVCN